MTTDAHRAATSSAKARSSVTLEWQLDLGFDEVRILPEPAWASLPEASRQEAMTLLARLLAKAGAAEEEGDA